MYVYEKKIAQREMKQLHFMYRVSVYPISEKGERLLGFKKGNSRSLKLKWYYTDPKETEEEHIRIVEQRIPMALAQWRVLDIKQKMEVKHLCSI